MVDMHHVFTARVYFTFYIYNVSPYLEKNLHPKTKSNSTYKNVHIFRV